MHMKFHVCNSVQIAMTDAHAKEVEWNRAF